MAHKSDTTSSETANFGTLPISNSARTETEAMLNVQKEMMTAYEEVSRSWIDRVKAEVELGPTWRKKLSAGTGTVPDGMQAYRDTVAQRMKMATEDGQRLFEEGQKIIGAVEPFDVHQLAEGRRVQRKPPLPATKSAVRRLITMRRDATDGRSSMEQQFEANVVKTANREVGNGRA